MPPTEKRYFLCTGECVTYKDLYKYPDSHIIGHLRYVVDEGRKVTALARWEVSVSAVMVPPLEPVIDMDIVGDARNIKCRYPGGCKHTVRWEIGKAAFLQLMSRYGVQRMEDLEKING